MMEGKQGVLRGKFDIRAILRVETGLHIGSASDFAPIGGVDSPFIRDPFTRQPVIPGSSLKGKLRTLLAKSLAPADQYVLNDIKDDAPTVQRLFGAAQDQAARPARLQFFDLKMTEASWQRFSSLALDTYIGEVKWENGINRLTAVPTLRQIERVPAGCEFDFRLVYNVEDEAALAEDMALLGKGLALLSWDYLGGHGSRGYGRVSLREFTVTAFSLDADNQARLLEAAETVLGQLEGKKP